MLRHSCKRTVQGSVHATEIDQQTDHSHIDSRRFVVLQFILKNLAGLAATGHCIDVDIREVHSLLPVGIPRKNGCLILKDQLQELVLDIFAP